VTELSFGIKDEIRCAWMRDAFIEQRDEAILFVFNSSVTLEARHHLNQLVAAEISNSHH
jgi:hypothetical protein